MCNFKINPIYFLKTLIQHNSIKYIFVLILTLFTFSQSFSQKNINDKAVSFKVFGNCVECKERIEGALQIKGIDSASWDVNTKMLEVVFDTSKIKIEKIQSKILAVGHDLEDKKADDKIYQSLPACCQYREKNDHSHASAESVSANSVSGVVLSEDSKGNLSPLEGASVYWSGSHDGTVSDRGQNAVGAV